MNFVDNETKTNLLLPFHVCKNILEHGRIDWWGLSDRIHQFTEGVISCEHPLLKHYVEIDDCSETDCWFAYFKPQHEDMAMALAGVLKCAIGELAINEHIDVSHLVLIGDVDIIKTQIELADYELRECEDKAMMLTLTIRIRTLRDLVVAFNEDTDFKALVSGLTGELADSEKKA